MHLNQSSLWKEAKLMGQTALLEMQAHEKEYIGQFIPPLLSCDALKKKELEIKSQLQLYCPKLTFDNRHSFLISQLFIG